MTSMCFSINSVAVLKRTDVVMM